MHRFDVGLAHGIRLSCRANQASLAGVDRAAPRVLFLHGFPEAAFVWDEVIGLLGSGCHALAPNLRGYEASSSPKAVKEYRARHLLQDLSALIETWGAPVDLLVAHDWGGALAWGLAAQRPELLKKLLIINAPHPVPFLRELKHNPAQQAASAYMNALCRDDAAARLEADDYAKLWRLLTSMGAATWLGEAQRAHYREVWSYGLDGALNYYRASPLRPPIGEGSPIHSVSLEGHATRVMVPTTVIWAEGDTALLPCLLDGLEAEVPQLSVHPVPGTHWIVHENPALIAGHVRALMAP